MSDSPDAKKDETPKAGKLINETSISTALQAENRLLQPKAAFYDTVVQSNDTADLGTVSKILNIRGIGRNKLFELLRDHKVLNAKNQPYQYYVDLGWFKVVETTYTAGGEQHINFKTVVYQKGIDGIRTLLQKRTTEVQPYNSSAVATA